MDTVLPSDRQARIDVRTAQLLREAFELDPPEHALWSEREIAVRDRCVLQATQEIDASV
jgi:hypothetical protein